MHFVYCMLLLIICFDTLVHCNGGSRDGGGGSRGGFTGGFKEGGNGRRSTSCDTHECQVRKGLIGAGVVVVPLFIWISIFVCAACCKSRARQENTTFVNSTYKKINRQKAYNVNPFQSGIWSGRYFQFEKWTAPHRFPLSFDFQSMKVTGSGLDDVGMFIIDGIYSTETKRIDLTKTYQLGTGNSLGNLAHQVTIQLTWNTQNRQFEGKWYMQTSIYHDNAKFELKFDEAYIKIESDNDGTFNLNSSYPDLLNGYVIREDYLNFLSNINSLQKRLKIYRCLSSASTVLIIFLVVAYILVSVFWQIYLDIPVWIFMILDFIFIGCIARTKCDCVDSKIKTVSQELKSTVKTISNTYSEWTLQMNDSSKKITLSIELSPLCQENILMAKPTSTPLLNTVTTIEIDEPCG